MIEYLRKLPAQPSVKDISVRTEQIITSGCYNALTCQICGSNLKGLQPRGLAAVIVSVLLTTTLIPKKIPSYTIVLAQMLSIAYFKAYRTVN